MGRAEGLTEAVRRGDMLGDMNEGLLVGESDDEKDIDLKEGVDKGLLVKPDTDAFGVTENGAVSV